MKLLFPLILFALAATTGAGIESVPISRIQGAGHVSPYAGKQVVTNGVVTRVYQDGFIIQSMRPDASAATSEALYVYQKDTGVSVGNELEVTGKVEEWTPGGEKSYNLSLTQIKAEGIRRTRSRAALPKPVELNFLLSDFPGQIKVPGSDFDPSLNTIDFWESMEHMRLVLLDARVTGPRTKYHEIVVRAPQGKAEPSTVRGGVKLTGYRANPAQVILLLDEHNPHPFSTGDRIAEPIHGNLTYSYGNYKIGVSKRIGPPRRATDNPAPPNPAVPSASLKIATFNVENLFPELADAKFQKIADIIIESLHSPDLIGLQEIQDNSGPQNDGKVDAGETLEKLVEFIEAAGGPRYRFLQENPENNADGGWPGGNIRNAYLYLPTLRPGSSYLLEDPAFEANDQSDYSGTRKPLVAFFTHGEQQLIFINCHLRSKGGDSPVMGALFPPIRFSEMQRRAQTQTIRKHAGQLRQNHPEAGIVVLGDMNDFEFSPALEILTRDGGLINLIDTVPLNERYTYIFQGFSQVLDHILVSPNLAPGFSAHIPHVNSDLSEGLRASDHDPVLAWLK